MVITIIWYGGHRQNNLSAKNNSVGDLVTVVGNPLISLLHFSGGPQKIGNNGHRTVKKKG